MSKAREVVPNLALSAAAVLIVGGGAELLARRGDHDPPASVATNIQDWQDWRDDFYTLRQTVVGTPPFEDYNHEGLRDREHDAEKPAAVRRIVCLGDSTTFGWGLRPEDAYPQALQDLLDAVGEPAEVFNMALPGWSTRQEAVAYRRIARRYAPDHVLLGVCLNDIPEMQNNLTRPPALLAALYRRSALVRRVVRARERQIEDVGELFTRPDLRRVRDAYRRLFDEVRALRDDVRKDGARLAILVFPFAEQVEPGARPPRPQEEIARFCRQEGIPFLDLLPALAAAGPKAFLDEDHFTAEGARAVAAAVQESGLVLEAPAGERRVEPRAAGRPGSAARVAELVQTLKGGGAAERAAAARALAGLGSKAAAAANALEDALRDPVPDVRSAATRALGSIGAVRAAVVPDLVRELRAGGVAERSAAAWALGRSDAKSTEIAAALAAAFDDPQPAVRWRAHTALARRRPGAEVLPRLLAVLEAPGSHARGAAAEVVGRMGPAAASAVPALVAALDDPRDDVRWHAVWAVGEIGPAAAAAVPRLVTLLEDPAVRWRAADALGSIGPAAGSAVPALAKAIDEGDETLRWRAARALGGIGRAGRSAASRLAALAGDTSDNVRLAAVHALGDVGGDVEFMPTLVGALRDSDRRVRHEAANVLGRLGPPARASIPALASRLHDEDAGVRAGAARALGRIGGLARAERLALDALRLDPDERVREAAARALAAFPNASP